MSHTTVPEVRAKLVDSILPAAIAALPSSITVGSETIALVAPTVYYGPPNTDVPPNSTIVVGATDTDDQEVASLPDAPLNRTRNERYNVRLFIWYLIGDRHVDAQRIATEAAFTIYRAVADELRADQTLGGALSAPCSAIITRIEDRDFDVVEGRACGLGCTLSIFTRV